MCRTRIKVFSLPISNDAEIENKLNNFIKDPKNEVMKVNSINVDIAYDEDDDPYVLAIISYELLSIIDY